MTEHTAPQHAELSASGAHRWAYCPGSVEAESHYPNTGSSYAHEGTVAHHVAALCLETGKDASAFAHTQYHVIERTDAAGNTHTRVTEFYLKIGDDERSVFQMFPSGEHADYIQEYVDYVRKLVKDTKGKLLVERRVDFSPWVPGGFGTSDAIVVCPDQTVHCVDLKYGQGVEVSAQGNDQARLYALGVFNEYDLQYEFKRFVTHIVQPRKRNFDTEELTTAELLAYGEFVKYRADLVLDPLLRESMGQPDFVAGEKQCGFCRAKLECRARAKSNLQLAVADFQEVEVIEHQEAVDLRNVLALTPAQVNKLLVHADEFEAWVKDLRKRGEALACEGKLDGWKMVEGRSVRKWTAAAVPVLTAAAKEAGVPETAIYKTPELIGIGDAEKLFGKKHPLFSSDAVAKPEGKPTLVPASDKRPALKLAHESAAADFAEAIAEDDLYS